jgi:hypothetical protein
MRSKTKINLSEKVCDTKKCFEAEQKQITSQEDMSG